MSEYLTYDEAAEYAGVSRRELKRWVDAGDLERIKVGKVFYHSAEDLDAAALKHNVFNSACFVLEYEFFRGQGMSHEVMAERLGVSQRHLVARAKRAGIYRPSQYEAKAQAVLDRLIDSGDQFVADALPCLFEPSLAASLMSQAVAAGRVRVAGKVRAKFTHSGVPLNVYEGVAA
ncbi:helix-turn-helix domain-containing protein [Rhodococcoides fascians]|uniref:helix-turn-helix domain-containing protein n=1 Tax=Rhodococcoides fascians TaxID=1828 RepID=UPI00050CCB3C|nr:helix-turn-helix domain-containing protein [Rhodococcus fascians]